MLGSIAGAVGAITGGLISNNQNRREAERNRSFQAYMSNTSHQREVADLKAAGLNPLLSGTGGAGASTPSGGQATMENVISPAVSSAMDASRLKKDLEAADAAIAKTKADTKLSDAATKKTNVDAIISTRNLPEAELKNKAYQYLLGINKNISNVEKQQKFSPKTRTEQFLKDTLKNWDEFPNRN